MGTTNGKRIEEQWQHKPMAKDQATYFET